MNLKGITILSISFLGLSNLSFGAGANSPKGNSCYNVSTNIAKTFNNADCRIEKMTQPWGVAAEQTITRGFRIIAADWAGREILSYHYVTYCGSVRQANIAVHATLNEFKSRGICR